MLLSSLFLAAAFAGCAVAKKCVNATVPVRIQARQGVFNNLTLPISNLDVTTFVQNVTQQGRNFTALALSGYQTTSGIYNISTQFCMPDGGMSSTPYVQVLTHGVGFDKTYWDLSYNNFNYSYVNAATSAGYCTLSYDRIGIGNSSHGDPLNEIQINLEVQGLRALSEMLINGTFPGVKHSFSRNIVHVGHSFGSAQTFILASMYPNITSGIILTGFTTNSSFTGTFLAGGNFQQARLNAPLRFGNITGMQAMSILEASPLADYLSGIDLTAVPPPQNLPSGYIVSNNDQATQLQFLKPGYFDPMILQVAEQTKQPAAIGELLTLGALPMPNNFTGPVLVLDGDGDVPFCGGDCTATGKPGLASLAAAVKMSFPKSSNFVSFIQPNTAHGINLHYNSTAAYQQMIKFLRANKLGSS